MAKKNNYREIYEKHFGKLPKGWHVHHIDGNPLNNDPWNLLGCSPEKHWDIHFQRGDRVAINKKFVQGAVEAGRNGGRAQKGMKQPNKAKKGKDNPFYGIKGPKHRSFIGWYTTPLGKFGSLYDAAEAHKEYPMTIKYRCRISKSGKFNDWSFDAITNL